MPRAKVGEVVERKDYGDIPISDEAMAFDRPEQEALLTMAASMTRNGVRDPVSLMRNPETGEVEVLDGYSRIEAAKLAKLVAVPCRLLPDDTDRIDYVRERNNLRRDQTVLQKVTAALYLFQQHPPEGWQEAIDNPRGRGRVTEKEQEGQAALAARYDAKTVTTTTILQWWCGGVTRQAIEQALNAIAFEDPGLIPWLVEEEPPPKSTPSEPRAPTPKMQKTGKLPLDPEELLRWVKGSTYSAKQVRRLGEALVKYAGTMDD